MDIIDFYFDDDTLEILKNCDTTIIINEDYIDIEIIPLNDIQLEESCISMK